MGAIVIQNRELFIRAGYCVKDGNWRGAVYLVCTGVESPKFEKEKWWEKVRAERTRTGMMIL